MNTMLITTYAFAELDERAQQRALDWYREGQTEVWEPDLDDVATCLRYLGIELDSDNRGRPDIHYRISWSQGDGASFEGVWHAEAMDLAELHQYTGDTTLHRLGAQLLAVLLCHPRAECRIITGVGVGIGWINIECVYSGESDDDGDPAGLDEMVWEQLKTAFRGCADWVYRRLRDDLEYQTSDESCTEGIDANGYQFDEDGRVV